MITDNIKSVGIELEGGINGDEYKTIKQALIKMQVIERFSFGEDGSVYVSGKDYKSIELKYYDDDLGRFLKVIKLVFNSGFKQNNTCGNHLHFVFSDNEKALSIFSFSSVWKLFREEYKKLADEMMRLFGNKYSNIKQKYLDRLENKYCKGKYNINAVIQQITCKSKDWYRYRMINLNSYNIHGTIEFRILPYFYDSEEAKTAITWLIKTVDKIYSKSKAVLKQVSKKIYTYNYSAKQFVINIDDFAQKVFEITEKVI
jgi:Putative amidoligase enzyme.